jgi:hypothetical protein
VDRRLHPETYRRAEGNSHESDNPCESVG